MISLLVDFFVMTVDEEFLSKIIGIKEMKLITENVEEVEGIEFTNEEEMEDYVVENVKVSSSDSTLKTKLQEDEFDWDDI